MRTEPRWRMRVLNRPMVVERLLHLYELVPGPRFDLAIEQLQGGLGFVFNDVWFRKEGTTLNVEAVASNGDVTLEAASGPYSLKYY